ncbi:MAG TPA: energy transducer TonB [Bacteroidales bacterium]|nr:energy transducer TonB [Bacteroidales bacterium]
MKDKNIFWIKSIFILAMFVFTLPIKTSAQEYKDQPYHNIEELEDENEGLYNQIYDIVKLYPDFSYTYVYDNGKVTDVEVTGVDNPVDRKRLELLILDWKQNSAKILDVPNRTGVYYSVEDPAEPVMGYVNFHQKLLQNITYPDNVKDAGVGGMVFLKFIVDDEGNVRYLTASEKIKSPYVNLVKELKKQAIEAFKETDAKWKPATMDGVPVASYVVEPVYFNFEKDPMIPGLIR